MYFEQIARLTAEHLNTHIAAYLQAIGTEFTGTDIATLIPPREIRVDSVVGGVFAAEIDELPLYAVDSLVKNIDPAGEDLYTYLYTGTIIGMVSGETSREVNQMIKRHEWAVEKFIREHLYLHMIQGTHFTITGFEFNGGSFSGGEQVIDDEDPTKLTWVDAFRIDVTWRVSEDGFSQHA
jgi:hypothetical protein